MPRQQFDSGNSDLEELGQLAQVAALLQRPGEAQQELNQREHATRLTAAIHLLGLQQQHESDQAQLQELARYHTGELQHGAASLEEQRAVRDASTKAGLLGDLMRTSGADVGTIEDTLAKVYPEYGAARQERQSKATAAEVAKFAPVVAAAKDDATRKQILSALHPDTQAGIAALGTTPVAPVAPTQPLPATLGRGARLLTDIGSQTVGNPLVAAGLIGAKYAPKTPPKGLMDFLKAYLGQTQPAQ